MKVKKLVSTFLSIALMLGMVNMTPVYAEDLAWDMSAAQDSSVVDTLDETTETLMISGEEAIGCEETPLSTELDASAQHEIADNGEGTSEVIVTTEAIQMIVTVPVSLPASIDAQGNVAVASNAKIINRSYAPVEVDRVVNISAAGGWTSQDDAYNFSKDNLGTKNFLFVINGTGNSKGAQTYLNEIGEGKTILDGINDTDTDEYVFTYDVKISGQREALSNVKVADVIFTITWAGI